MRDGGTAVTRPPREPAAVREYHAYVEQTMLVWRRFLRSEPHPGYTDTLPRLQSQVSGWLHGARMMAEQFIPRRQGLGRHETERKLETLYFCADAQLEQDVRVFKAWWQTIDEVRSGR